MCSTKSESGHLLLQLITLLRRGRAQHHACYLKILPASQTAKTKEIPRRADHHPCVLFPVAFTTTNLNSNT